MVPDFIWAPDFLGPREIRSPRNLGPTKVGSCMKMLCNDFHAGIKFLWAQTFQGPNFSGTKFLGGPKKTGAQMRPRTISVIAEATPWLSTRLDGP